MHHTMLNGIYKKQNTNIIVNNHSRFSILLFMEVFLVACKWW